MKIASILVLAAIVASGSSITCPHQIRCGPGNTCPVIPVPGYPFICEKLKNVCHMRCIPKREYCQKYPESEECTEDPRSDIDDIRLLKSVNHGKYLLVNLNEPSKKEVSPSTRDGTCVCDNTCGLYPECCCD